jgi:hypothetical protein
VIIASLYVQVYCTFEQQQDLVQILKRHFVLVVPHFWDCNVHTEKRSCNKLPMVAGIHGLTAYSTTYTDNGQEPRCLIDSAPKIFDNVDRFPELQQCYSHTAQVHSIVFKSIEIK